MFVSPSEDPNDPFNEQNLTDVMEKLQEETRKMGLYVSTAVLHQEPVHDPALAAAGEKPQTKLIVSFTLGDIAFSDRIQNPEKDQVEDQFREIEHGTIRDQVEDIKGSGRDLLDSMRNLDEEEEEEPDEEG